MPDRWATLRIIDANLNRAQEALRVAEDYARFALEDAHLSGECKQLRHELVSLALEAIPLHEALSARSTQSDVGTQLATKEEGRRPDLRACAAAAWQRVHQALRVLEETFKLLAPASAPRIEQLRYKTYILARACLGTAASRQRLAACRLYVLVDGAASEDVFSQRVLSLIRGGVHAIQLRDKRLTDRELLSRARLARRLIDQSQPAEAGAAPIGRPLLIVNDRPDLALLARADGVHVGQEELSVADVRRVVGPELLVGVSTHNMEQARQAVLEGADYLGCGPTFPSETKQFDQFPGLPFLRQVAAEIGLPAFAIGGITRHNLPQVLATGMRRVAVARALAEVPNVEAEVGTWLLALSQPVTGESVAAGDGQPGR